MSDDEALSRSPPPKEALPGGSVYIGMSNTRGVIMQIHLQRFQNPLLANLAGLAATGAWLTTGEHSLLGLWGCVVWCLAVLYLSRFWRWLLKDTTGNLGWWSQRINNLVFDLGIKDHLLPGVVIERPEPRVQERDLYRILQWCSVAWGAMTLVAFSMALQQIGGIQWILWKLDLWLFWSP